MNIFATSPDPAVCAADLDDARVVNQLRETCQMLSTAWHVGMAGASGPTPDFPHRPPLYAPAHERHPATRWVSSCAQAFQWTVDHAVALSNEYHLRFQGDHASARLAWAFMGGREYLADLFPEADGLPPFADCAANSSLGLDFRGHEGGVHAGYRDYLRARWGMAARPPRWHRGLRGGPSWL